MRRLRSSPARAFDCFTHTVTRQIGWLPNWPGTAGQFPNSGYRRPVKKVCSSFDAVRAPVAAEAAIPEESDDSERSAGGINDYIRPSRAAIGDEGLMEFVGGGVDGCDNPGDEGCLSTPPSCRSRGLCQGSDEEPRQNRVLGYMGGFAHQEND